jgi:excisionase family DNA binding protein
MWWARPAWCFGGGRSKTVADPFTAALKEIVREAVRDEVRAAVRDLFPAAPPPASDYLTVQQAADLIKVTPATVREWIRHKKLPAACLADDGKRKEYRVRRSDLEAFLTRARPATAPDETAARILSMAAGKRGR